MAFAPFRKVFEVVIDEEKTSSFYDAKRILLIYRITLINALFSFIITFLLIFIYHNWEAFILGNIIGFSLLIPAYLVQRKNYFRAKIAFEVVLFLIGITVAIVFGRHSLAEFLPMFIPIRALLFFQKPNTALTLSISAIALLLIQLIYIYIPPMLVIENPIIMTMAIGTMMTYIGFILVRMYRDEVLAVNDLVLKKNKEVEQAYHLIEEKNIDLIKANEKLNILNLDLQQFASMASHDMREPLRTISNFASLLRKRNKEDTTSKEFLDFIVDAAKRMSGLLDDLIEYARAGIPKDEVRPIDLNNIVLMAQQNLNKLLQENQGDIQTTQLPIIIGHSTLFLQLFQNIISNGLKFRQQNTPPVVTLKHQLSDKYLVIEISDNGIGIEEQFLKKVFEPFLRLHAVGVYEGSGIGLATCKKIVEFYQGHIEVKSTVGKGTTFEIWLPSKMLQTA
jgi:signal transduction histidine kinase